MSILDARELKKSLGTRTLLGGVSLTINERERVGLVGPNGCGKSTLARILAALDPADGGEIATRREARVLYLEQEPSFPAEQTAIDAVLSGMSEWQDAQRRYRTASEALAGATSDPRWLAAMERAANDLERHGGWDREHEARALMGHLAIRNPEGRLGTMSGGERRRVALARLLVASPDLAVLDEPTNHLDVETIEWLEEYLVSTFPGALLLVTHDRWFLNHVVTRTLELERGELHSYEGGWEEYLEAKAERDELTRRNEQNRQNLLRRELEWLRRTPAARTGKQKARVNRAQAVVANTPVAKERTAALAMESARSGKTIVDFEDVVVELGGRRLIDGLTLSMSRGERLGVVGPNGAGKSTLLKLITGELVPNEGKVNLGASIRIAYLDQNRSGLEPERSVADNVSPNSRQVDWNGRRMELISYLERMLFTADQQRQPVSALSGGERARVLLARMLLQSANLLILDEPTNDLDAPTLSSLEEMLSEFEGAAIVVTHDRWFLERVATSILAFEGEGKVRRWAGSYSTWRSLAAEEAERAIQSEERRGQDGSSVGKVDPSLAGKSSETKSAAKSALAGAAEPTTKSAKRKLSFSERRELDGMLDRIDEHETEIARREADLNDPQLYASRGAEVADLLAALERKKAELETLMARWEELESLKDA